MNFNPYCYFSVVTKFVMIGMLSFCVSCTFEARKDRLTALERGVRNDIRQGQDLDGASNILTEKYHASIIDMPNINGDCDRLFSVSDKMDRFGVYYTLIVRLSCKGERVSRVETAIVGSGP